MCSGPPYFTCSCDDGWEGNCAQRSCPQVGRTRQYLQHYSLRTELAIIVALEFFFYQSIFSVGCLVLGVRVYTPTAVHALLLRAFVSSPSFCRFIIHMDIVVIFCLRLPIFGDRLLSIVQTEQVVISTKHYHTVTCMYRGSKAYFILYVGIAWQSPDRRGTDVFNCNGFSLPLSRYCKA